MAERNQSAKRNMALAMTALLDRKRAKLLELEGRLSALSPRAILQRGYSITRTVPGARVVSGPGDVSIGEDVEILLADGALIGTVKEKREDG